MKKLHTFLKIVLTEEEAFALEPDQSKWPVTWTIVWQQSRKAA